MTSPFTFLFTPPTSPGLTLPADVFALIIQVDAEIGALNADMIAAMNSGKDLPQEFKDQRDQFVVDWTKYKDWYLSYGWTASLPGNAWDQVVQYEAKNEAWRDRFKALGGKTGPGPQDRPQGADVTGAVKWSAAAVIAAAVAYGVYEFAGKRRSN